MNGGDWFMAGAVFASACVTVQGFMPWSKFALVVLALVVHLGLRRVGDRQEVAA